MLTLSFTIALYRRCQIFCRSQTTPRGNLPPSFPLRCSDDDCDRDCTHVVRLHAYFEVKTRKLRSLTESESEWCFAGIGSFSRSPFRTSWKEKFGKQELRGRENERLAAAESGKRSSGANFRTLIQSQV